MFNVLVHYTTAETLKLIRDSGAIGRPGHGVWLRPEPLSACMSPYELGLGNPCDVALLVNPQNVPVLWGPGTAKPSSIFGDIWIGGGVEFFAPSPIPFTSVTEVVRIDPCGDVS